MGADVHTFIVKDKKVIAKDLYDGRNYEWFDNLQGNGYNDVYDHFLREWGFSPEAPDAMKERYTEANGYYGFLYIKVEDFIDWYLEFQPHVDAGWVNTYDAWLIKHKKYHPEYLKKSLDKDDIIQDMHFIEYEDPYEPSSLIYDYLIKNNIDKDADIQFFFDC